MSKIKIDTLGCCILRDVFRIGDVEENRVKLNRNIGFISPLSMFSKPITKIQIDVFEESYLDSNECFEEALARTILQEFNGEKISNFVKRNCFLDLNKNIFDYLQSEEKAFLFMDISDLRLRVLVKGDFSVTIREDSCKEVKIIRPLLERDGFVVKNIWDFPEEEVFKTLEHLAKKLLEYYSKDQIFFLNTAPTPLFINKCGDYIDDDESMHQKYRNCRPRELTKYNNYFINLTRCNVIEFPVKEKLVASTNHIAGLFPLHYIDDVYRYYYCELIQKIEQKSNLVKGNNYFLHRIEKYINEAKYRNNYSNKLPDNLIKAVSEDGFCEYVDGLAKSYSSLIVLCVKDTIGFCVSQLMNTALHSLGLHENFRNFRKIHQKGYIAIISNGIVVEEIIGTEECKAVSANGIFYGNILEVESKPLWDGNLASIVWNGHDFSVNKRGINFFVYDYHTNHVCDVRCYDTHSKECILIKNNDFLDKDTALLISMEKILGLLCAK